MIATTDIFSMDVLPKCLWFQKCGHIFCQYAEIIDPQNDIVFIIRQIEDLYLHGSLLSVVFTF